MTDTTSTTDTTTTTDTTATTDATAVAWYAGLPDELKADPSVTRYASPEEAARGLIHYTKHFGVPSDQIVRLPKPDDAEGQGKLWNTLGRPETPDKYDVKLPDGSPLDKDALSSFLATMHKTGPMTPALAKGAVEWYAGFAKQQAEAMTATIKAEGEAATAALKAEWGAAYQTKFDAAAAVANQVGGPDLVAMLNETGLGNDPRLIKAFDKMAELMREAGPPQQDRGRDANRPLSPIEAEAELVKMEGDPESKKALEDPNNSNHKHFVDKRLELIRLTKVTA